MAIVLGEKEGETLQRWSSSARRGFGFADRAWGGARTEEDRVRLRPRLPSGRGRRLAAVIHLQASGWIERSAAFGRAAYYAPLRSGCYGPSTRVSRRFGLKPLLVAPFKPTPGPQIIDRARASLRRTWREAANLDLNPPKAVVVLFVAEQTQMLALDRSRSGQALLPSVLRYQRHKCVSRGATNLFAALAVAAGEVSADLTPRRCTRTLHQVITLIEA